MSPNALWNKKLRCPFCDHEFETTRLRASAVKVKEKESDFGSVFDGLCGYFYAVTACPQCLFAARNEDFESVRPEYEHKLMELCKKTVAAKRPKPDIFGLGEMSAEVAIKRHELALAFMKLRSHVDLGEIAGLTMHLAWISRLIGDKDREAAAMEQALKAYEEYFEKGGKLPEKLGEPGVLYLIGELHMRLGRPRNARRNFERALASKEIKSFPNIEGITRDRMLTAKTEMERQAQALAQVKTA